jgi:hypothetical protein
LFSWPWQHQQHLFFKSGHVSFVHLHPRGLGAYREWAACSVFLQVMHTAGSIPFLVQRSTSASFFSPFHQI